VRTHFRVNVHYVRFCAPDMTSDRTINNSCSRRAPLRFSQARASDQLLLESDGPFAQCVQRKKCYGELFSEPQLLKKQASSRAGI
jgi:hypothetical protein